MQALFAIILCLAGSVAVVCIIIGLLRWLLRINDAIDRLDQIAQKLDDISKKLDEK